MPKTVFAGMRGDSRSGDVTSSLKIFSTLEKARAYALEQREKHPEVTSYVTVIELEVNE